MNEEKPPRVLPSYYAHLYAMMVPVARDYGYALALHGSLARDLDVVAVPWRENPASRLELAKALTEAVGGFEASEFTPGVRPHGRLCWTIHLGGGPFIDLSVMPPIPELP